jgi:hypothetical protein
VGTAKEIPMAAVNCEMRAEKQEGSIEASYCTSRYGNPLIRIEVRGFSYPEASRLLYLAASYAFSRAERGEIDLLRWAICPDTEAGLLTFEPALGADLDAMLVTASEIAAKVRQ